MRVLGEFDSEGLPRPIPADELQVMIGPNEEFCTSDAWSLKVSGEMARWPFLSSGHREPAGHKPNNAPFERRKGCGTPST
jgi:hypothetical protein